MTRDEAFALTARLVAAYAYPPVSDETVLLYVERFMPLDARACRQAVDQLIDADLEHLPRIGRVRALTLAITTRQRERATTRLQLDAPPPSDEERRRIRELVESVTRRVTVAKEDPHAE